MFVDHIKIYAKAGDGGSGAVSFRREKFVPKGGPDGGDGGRGGDIIFRVDPNVDTLASFFYEPIIKAKNGERGQGKNCYGRNAKNVVINVPPGTLVYRMRNAHSTGSGQAGMRNEESVPTPSATFYNLENETEPLAEQTSALHDPAPDFELLVDLNREGEEFVLCKGGDGGKGNTHYKTSTNRVPRQFGEGWPGEEGHFYLELRKIADAGLVGYPNAGKSTLLGKISAAHPKVAPYPFTTLHPIVGVVEFPGYQRATVADIPGLIEGAHRDVGLGHDFLRHIVRCKLLLHVIDMAGSEGRSPIDDLRKLREELKLYDPTLTKRPWLVIANKMDLPNAGENLRSFKRHVRRVEIIPVSANEGIGMDALKARLGEVVKERPAESPATQPSS